MDCETAELFKELRKRIEALEIINYETSVQQKQLAAIEERAKAASLFTELPSTTSAHRIFTTGYVLGAQAERSIAVGETEQRIRKKLEWLFKDTPELHSKIDSIIFPDEAK